MVQSAAQRQQQQQQRQQQQQQHTLVLSAAVRRRCSELMVARYHLHVLWMVPRQLLLLGVQNTPMRTQAVEAAAEMVAVPCA